MANNYTPSYNQYRTQTAGYALPSSVRTYSVFDPASNSWRRMTNDGRSPMPASPAQQQADIAGALAQAKQTQGMVYPAQGMVQTQTPGILLRPKTPVQTPVQTPLGSPRMASPASKASQVQAPMYTGGGYAEIRKPFPDPMADDDFLHESPRPEPKRNVNITVIPRGNANPNNAKKPVESASNQPTLFDDIALYNPLNIGRLLLMKGAKEAKPYVTDAIDTYNRTMQEAGNAIRNWGSGFMNWLQR